MKRKLAPACIHHWQLPAPNGPLASAVCKRCGVTRAFENTVGGCILKGPGLRSNLINSWLAEGRAVRAAADTSGATLAQAAENFSLHNS